MTGVAFKEGFRHCVSERRKMVKSFQAVLGIFLGTSVSSRFWEELVYFLKNKFFT